MGDYADYIIDSGMTEEFPFGRRTLRSRQSPRCLKYAELIWETRKAWLLRLATGTVRWFPKSCCSIRIQKSEIYIPKELDYEVFKQEAAL